MMNLESNSQIISKYDLWILKKTSEADNEISENPYQNK